MGKELFVSWDWSLLRSWWLSRWVRDAPGPELNLQTSVDYSRHPAINTGSQNFYGARSVLRSGHTWTVPPGCIIPVQRRVPVEAGIGELTASLRSTSSLASRKLCAGPIKVHAPKLVLRTNCISAGGVSHKLCRLSLGGETAVRILERHSAHIWVQAALLPHHLRPPRWATITSSPVLVACTYKVAQLSH